MMSPWTSLIGLREGFFYIYVHYLLHEMDITAIPGMPHTVLIFVKLIPGLPSGLTKLTLITVRRVVMKFSV